MCNCTTELLLLGVLEPVGFVALLFAVRYGIRLKRYIDSLLQARAERLRFEAAWLEWEKTRRPPMPPIEFKPATTRASFDHDGRMRSRENNRRRRGRR
jgi:hypothetical protein